MKKKFDIRMTGRHKLAGVLFSGLIFLTPSAFAEKVKKPNLPKSYASKAAPAEITDSDRVFIELREAAKKIYYPITIRKRILGRFKIIFFFNKQMVFA